MNLKERIEQYKRKSAGKATEEMVAVMSAATGAVRDSIAGRNIPKLGAAFPDFSLIGSEGSPVQSELIRQSGPLVVTFFRGMW